MDEEYVSTDEEIEVKPEEEDIEEGEEEPEEEIDYEIDDEDELLRDIANIDIRAAPIKFGIDTNVKGIVDNVEQVEHKTSHYLDLFELSNVIDYVKSVMCNDEYKSVIDDIIKENNNRDIDFIAWIMIERKSVPFVVYRERDGKMQKIEHTNIELKPRNYYY